MCGGAGQAGDGGEVRPVLGPGGQLSVQTGRERNNLLRPSGVLGNDLFPGKKGIFHPSNTSWSLQVEDVNRKFTELKKIEANDWRQLEEPGQTVQQKLPANNGKKSGARKRTAGKAEASAGLKALIAAKRKCLEEEVKEGPAVKDKENVSQQPSDDQLHTSPEKTFDGGFFTIKSPFCEEMTSRRERQPDTRITRSAGLIWFPLGNYYSFHSFSGSDKLRKSALTESAKRMSGFVSPFVSQLGKRSLAGGEKSSPVRAGGVRSVRRASLFDDDED